jgi:hypothetical protein
MNKLTREEALRRCRDHWLWVATTGKPKDQYPYEGDRPEFNCYACEYNTQNDNRFCEENCIIPWPGGACYSKESPFSDYNRADMGSEEEKAAALAIVALCDLAMLRSNGGGAR